MNHVRFNSEGQKIIFADRSEIEDCYLNYLRRMNESAASRKTPELKTIELKRKRAPKGFKGSTSVKSFRDLAEACRGTWTTA